MKPGNPTLRPWLLVLSATAVFSAAVHATTYDFTGGTSGNWGIAGNWQGGVVPTFDNVADLKFGVNAEMTRNLSFLSNNRIVRSLEFGNTSTAVDIDLSNNSGTARVLTFDSDSGNATINVNSNVSANVTIGSTAFGSITLADNLAVTNASSTATLIINRPISETGGARDLIKDGVGVLQIGGANTFTGTTTVNGGVLQIDADSRLGTAPASYVADQLTLDGGTLRPSTSFTMSANRGITLGAGGGSIDIAAGTFNCNGIITGSGSLTTSANAPAQAVNLGRANDYSGSTTVNSGTLRLQTGGTIPSSSNLTINGGGNFNARNTNGWIHTGTITGDGTGYVYLSHGTNATLDGNISGLTKIDVDTDGTNATISGDISGDTNVSILSGGGILTLSGTNTYSGVTNVANGTLIVNGDNSGANGDVTVNGTLKGSGIIGANVTISGTLAAGNSIGSLATGALSLAAGSTFQQEINNSVGAAVAGDLVAVTGNLGLNNEGVFPTLQLVELGAGSWNAGDKLTLISYSGTWDGGLFRLGTETLADDSTFAFSGIDWRFNYNDAVAGLNYTEDLTGDSFVTMTAIPEPGAALLGSLGLLALLRRRR